jgi:hypothetical protein
VDLTYNPTASRVHQSCLPILNNCCCCHCCGCGGHRVQVFVMAVVPPPPLSVSGWFGPKFDGAPTTYSTRQSGKEHDHCCPCQRQAQHCKQGWGQLELRGGVSNKNNKDNNIDAQQLHKLKKITLCAYFFVTHVMPQKPHGGKLIHEIST